jgi:hypothetical protein
MAMTSAAAIGRVVTSASSRSSLAVAARLPTSRRSRSAARDTLAASPRASSCDRAPPSPEIVPAAPWITVIGVMSSWERTWINSLFVRSRSWSSRVIRSERSSSSTSSWITSAVTSVERLAWPRTDLRIASMISPAEVPFTR